MSISASNDTLIPRQWRLIVHLVWVVLVLLLMAIYIIGLAPHYLELSEVCEAEDCTVLTLNPLEVGLLNEMGLSLDIYAAIQIGLEIYLVLIFSSLAFIIFLMKSDTWIGVVVSLAFMFVGIVFFAEEARTLARLYPDLQSFMDFLSSLSVALFLLLFYLFPDGRFVPRWTGWVFGGLFTLLLLDPLFIQSSMRGPSATIVVLFVYMVGAVLGAYAQIYRYRKVSNLVQRQQTKWVVLGFVSMISMTLFWGVLIELSILDRGPLRLAFNFSLIIQYLIMGFFPLSVVISIMRYRLWDIDLILRRTMQYTLLTGMLSLVYFGVVAFLQAILTAIGGQSSTVVIVISTLVIAGMFNPLRRRLQDFIDRRFYRQKYDAEYALAKFATAARRETDLDYLTGAMVHIVNETIQPEYTRLWITSTEKKEK